METCYVTSATIRRSRTVVILVIMETCYVILLNENSITVVVILVIMETCYVFVKELSKEETL